jgi:hypothetical protein
MPNMNIIIDDGEKKEQIRQMTKYIEDAKWKMYAESWEGARTDLFAAKDIAVALRDKSTIDQIMGMLKDLTNHIKPKL